MLASRQVWEFIRYALWSHFPRLEPLLRRMAESHIGAVSTAGVSGSTIGWLLGRALRELVEGYPAVHLPSGSE